MNGGTVAIKVSAVIALPSVDCAAADTGGVSICGSRTFSSPLGLPETETGAVSGNAFGGVVLVSLAARASARLTDTAR